MLLKILQSKNQKKLLLLLFLTVKLYTYNFQGEESLNMYYF